MASSDRIEVLADDETAERWNSILAESSDTEPEEQELGSSPESQQTPAPITSPQPSLGFIERTCSHLNRHLLVSKVFYFFFYTAYGSLHPLLAIYYKQLGLSASQSGLLVGIRYFIEFCSAPFWGVVADRFKKGKVVLLFSVMCYLLFNCSIAFVKPADMYCVEVISPGAANNSSPANTSHSDYRVLQNHMRGAFDISTTFFGVESIDGFQSRKDSNSTEVPTVPNMTSPATTTTSSKTYKVIFNLSQVKTIFLLILLVIIIGEFFSAPAVTIVDTVTLKYLGRHRNRYGLQRMWGSLGWGLAMLSVGISIDHTRSHPFMQGCISCEQHDFLIAFIMFGVLMGVALIVATQFYFPSNMEWALSDAPPADIFRQGMPPPGTNPPEFRFSDLLRVLCSVRYITVLFVAWFMGFGYGFVFSFLYWYLQSLNGSTTLFGICSVLSHLSELIAYFTSHKLIELIGHIRVLYIGLACNTARFLYISYLENAWIILPMEVLQGMTHALVWAACISYLSATVPLSLRTSTQGILQGLHLGLGRGCGAMVGGVFVTYFGEASTFRGIGMASLVILVTFYFIQCLMGQDDESCHLEENALASSSPVAIATIDLTQQRGEPQASHPEQQQPKMKKHQEEQQDGTVPAWAFSVSPWVTLAFTLCQVREMIKMAKRGLAVDTQPLQRTNEEASPVPPAEEVPATQPNSLEQPSPANKPIKRKKSKDRSKRHPSLQLPADLDSIVENPSVLPGNFEFPSHMFSNNPFYQ